MSVTEAFSGSATIGTTEYDLPSASTSVGAQTADGIYQPIIDFSALAAGDIFEVKAYEKVQSSGTQRVCQRFTVGGIGAIVTPNWAAPALMLIHGWTYTIKKLAGTDRAIAYSIKRMDATIVEDFANSATISTTEYDLPNNSTTVSSQTADGVVQIFLDLNNLAAGDHYWTKFYEKARSGDTQRVVERYTHFGAQGTPIWTAPSLIVAHGWTMTVQKKAGTDRAIPWSIRRVA